MYKKYYAYMLLCSDGSIYSGYTVNLEKRILSHNKGKGAKYTRSRLPVKLVYYEIFNTKAEAMKKEAALKRLSHMDKIKMINDFESKISDLVERE